MITLNICAVCALLNYYNNKEYRVKILFFIFIAILPSLANANYYCTGKVAHLGSSGALHMSNGFGVHRLCNFDEPRCNAWFSMLMAAKMADREVSIYYQNSSPAGGEQNDGLCQDIGSWVTPADRIYYVQVH